MATKVSNHFLFVSIITYLILMLVLDYYNSAFILIILACDMLRSRIPQNQLIAIIISYILFFPCYIASYITNLTQYTLVLLAILLLISSIRLFIYMKQPDIHLHHHIQMLAWIFSNFGLGINLYYDMTHKDTITQGIGIILHFSISKIVSVILVTIYVIIIIKISKNLTILRELLIYLMLIAIDIGCAAIVEGISSKIFISPVYAVGTFAYCYSLYKYPIIEFPEHDEIDSAGDDLIDSPKLVINLETTPLIVKSDIEKYKGEL